MPFTPSHTAIVLPLLRSRYFSATALVIGSMAPDFEYFFTMNDKGYHGHTLAGIFYFDVPVTLLLAWCFHRFIKEPAINNLPYFFQRRLNELKYFQFDGYIKKYWLQFILSAVLGTLTHLFWDSFTHPNTWVVSNLSIYKTIVPINGAKYPLYYALQLLSSYVGLGSITIYIILMRPLKGTEVVKPNPLYWITVLGISVLVMFLRFYWLPETFNLVRGVICSLSALMIALFFAGLMRFQGNSSFVEVKH